MFLLLLSVRNQQEEINGPIVSALLNDRDYRGSSKYETYALTFQIIYYALYRNGQTENARQYNTDFLNGGHKEAFIYLLDIPLSDSIALTTPTKAEFYTLLNHYRDQTGLDPLRLFAGGKMEYDGAYISKLTTFIHAFKWPNLFDDDYHYLPKATNNDMAFLHNQYIQKRVFPTLGVTPVYFVEKESTSKHTNKPIFVLFIGAILFLYTLFMSGNITFYKDFLTSKITKYLNTVGYPMIIQFVSTQLVSTFLTLPLTLIISVLIQQIISYTTKLAVNEILLNLLCLIQIQFVCNCVTILIYNVLPAFFMSFGSLLTAIVMFMTTMIPLPEEEGTFYKLLFFMSPLNSMTYFLWFQAKMDNRGFKAFKHFTDPFKSTKPIVVFFIQLTTSLLIGLVSFIFYKMDTGILTSSYRLFNKVTKKLYNLVFRRKDGVEVLNSKKVYRKLEGKSGKVETTKDKLVIENLSKSYATFGDKIKVLDGVNLELSKGEKVALLGHNGCGKTTFLNSLIGMISRSSGRIYLDNRKIRSTSDLQGRLGYCPQFTKTIPSLNVLENLEVVSNLYSVSRQDIKEVLKGLDLFKHRKKQVSQLSGGQKRKLGFAMAVISSAPLIVLDEPTTGIDVLSRKIIFQLLRKYSKDSIVIFSTHLIEEAENYADKVAILSQGKLMAFDTVTNIKRKFNIVYNRLSINFLEATNREFVDKLKEDYKLKIVNEGKKSITLEIREISDENLALLYAFMDGNRHLYKVESYGIYKASLEEVLNLQEFRELNKMDCSNNQDDTVGTNGTGKEILKTMNRNLNKKTTPFSTLKALLYHNAISLFIDFKAMLYITVISIMIFVFFNNSNYRVEFKTPANEGQFSNSSFKKIPFNLETFQINSTRKLKIKTFDLTNGVYTMFVNYLKKECSIKDSLEISNVELSEVFKVYKKENSSESKEATGDRLKVVLNKHEHDLFILQLEHQILIDAFHLYIPREFRVDIDETVITVVQNEHGAMNQTLLNFLYAEFLAHLANTNKDIKTIEQELIINQDYQKQKKDLEVNFWLRLLVLVVVYFFVTLIIDKLVGDRESGIHTLWNINGVSKLVILAFDLIFYTALTFAIIALPIIFANARSYRSISSFLLWPYMNSLLICIFSIASLSTMLSFLVSKQAINQIKNGLILLVFASNGTKGFFALFLKTNDLQHYLFWNPFHILFELLIVLIRGEVHIKTLKSYYFYNIGIGKPIMLGNWAMNNYIQTHFLSLLTFETMFFLVVSLLAVFRVLAMANEWVKRYEFKNVRAKSNLNILNEKLHESQNNADNHVCENRMALKNVTKIYGHKFMFNANYALQNFNLKATSGESIGVLGANGGGKTTAFKLLTKELEQTFGDINLDNKKLSSIKKGYMGYVPQYEALPQNMTPYQVLKFYAILYNWAGEKTEAYIQNTLELMKLRKNKYKKISTLSGGNKRKVVLAISILLDKDLLVLDEPTTGVDITNCQDIWNVVQSKARNKTILLASHSTRESEQLTNRIIILVKGVIVASGTKEAIREEHGKTYEVEIEMHEKDEELNEKLEKLKGVIDTKFRGVKFDVKNNFKFSCFIEKRYIQIYELIRLFAVWRVQFDIKEFFVNESALEDILRDKLEEKKDQNLSVLS